MHEAMQPTAEPGWVLTHEGYNVLTENAVESRFALGNGFLGMRASRPVSRGPTWVSWLGYIRWASWPRCYVAGLFDNPTARLLGIHHIKRVPVVRDGVIVGIVSRADLLGVVAAGQKSDAAAPKAAQSGFLAGLFSKSHRPTVATVSLTNLAEDKPKHDRLTADDFRGLEADFRSDEMRHRDDARRAAAKQRQQWAKELIDAHLFDDSWREMLHRAREVAEVDRRKRCFCALRTSCVLMAVGRSA